VQLLVDELLDREAAAGSPARERRPLQLSPQTQRLANKLHGALRFFEQLDAAQRVLIARDLALDPAFAPAYEELDSLSRQLDELLDQVDRYRMGEAEG
jgi:hypothetical protein